MTLPRLLALVLCLTACAATPVAVPAPATPRAATPAAATAPARPAAAAEASPARRLWDQFLEGLPKARSRTGLYELALTRVGQVPQGESVAVEVQAQLTTRHPDVLLDRVPKPVRRLVMNDGTELSYPEQFVTISSGQRAVAAGGMDVFHEHSGVWDLVLDATIVEVVSWQEFELPSVGPGAHEGLWLGPFDVGIDAQPDALSIGFFSIEGRRFDAWVSTLSQPVLSLVTHRFAAEAVEVTDAAGRALESHGGGGSGGATSATFGHAAAPGDAGPSPIAYPVRLRLRLPVRYRLEMSSFRWEDLPIEPLRR